MAIKIVVSDTVAFKVKGTINDAEGKPEAFDFRLTCKRLDAEEIKTVVSDNEGTIKEFLQDTITGWSGVQDGNGASLPYSADALAQLLLIPGLSAQIFRTYLAEVGTKEKN